MDLLVGPLTSICISQYVCYIHNFVWFFRFRNF